MIDLDLFTDEYETTLCYCIKVTRKDGLVLTFTDHDQDLIVQGLSYPANTGINTSRIKQTAGLAADNFDIEGVIDGEVIKGEDLESGKFDDATVYVYIVNWKDTTKYLTLAKGYLSDVTLLEESFKAEFRSLVDKLGQSVGKTYQRSCQAKLGDDLCKVDLEQPAYKFSGTVSTLSNQSATILGLNTYTDGWFTLGKVVSNGKTYPISSHVGDNVTFWLTPYNLSVGDSVDVYAGCKQDIDTCSSKFNNTLNYRGFNLMPTQDAVTNYASRGTEVMDGGSLFET